MVRKERCRDVTPNRVGTSVPAHPHSRERRPSGTSSMLIFGLNPVLEALRAGRVRVVRVSSRGG